LLYVAANLTTAMTPALVLTIVYFGACILISVIAGKGINTNTFTVNRQSPWYAGAGHWLLVKILMPLYSPLNFVSIHTHLECGSASGVTAPVTSLLNARESVYIRIPSHCLRPKENQTSLFSTHYQELPLNTFA
jgi:hypothetical protein